MSYVPWIPHLLYYQKFDPCTHAGANHAVPFSVAISCYNSFPLTYSQEKDTLVTLAALSDLDVQGRDIKITLDKVKGKNHLTEHNFHKDITITYNEMSDIHYKYTSQCFSTFEFVHPFPIELVNNEFQIAKNFLHHPKLIKEWISFDIETRKYTACKVIEINDIPVFKFLEEYSQTHVGSTSDPQARLALTLARAKFKFGEWVVEEGAFSRTRIAPDKPYLELTIVYMNELIKIKAPYLAISPQNFDSRASFYSQNCLKARNSFSKYSPKFWLPKSQSLFWDETISIHRRSRTGILKIQKFKKESPILQVKNIVSALGRLNQHNITSLILDLSDATGDYACMSQLLMKTLFDKRIDIWFQFRHAPLMDAMINTVQTDMLFNVSFTFEEELFTPTSFLKTRFYRYRNLHSSYTPPLQEKCPQDAEFVPGLIPDKVAVMTNGICFGACARFVSEVSSLPQVKTFKAGGMKRSPALLASSSDYGRIDSTEIIDTLASFMETSKPGPLKPFASVVQLNVPAREFIRHNKAGADIQSQSLLAHHHINHDATDLPFTVWDHISDHLNQRAPNPSLEFSTPSKYSEASRLSSQQSENNPPQSA
ncbi:hypothetical protein DSO57_1023241 [Entomophthora muscae]|uniref:Uncharacterized protein n=1 Tax=Entomophthora muscae TaxID=34485 RepID=A0ACC2RHV8_9FUNG|nr:hypothetical protein DSO57_1023241 [Entomophthora muscae]